MAEGRREQRFECPECGVQARPPDEAKLAFFAGQGREQTYECPEGHVHSLHELALQAKCRPSYYEILHPHGGVEEGLTETQIGTWLTVSLRSRFQRIRHLSASCVATGRGGVPSADVRVLCQMQGGVVDCFALGVCSSNAGDLGQPAVVSWRAYGDTGAETSELWRDNLMQAALDLLGKNYRAAVLHSAIAVEIFSVEYVTEALAGERPTVEPAWDPHTVRTFLVGPYAPGLSAKGRFLVACEGILGIPFQGTAEFASWKKLSEMRNKLAHGQLGEYRAVRTPGGDSLDSDEDRARFAYETAVRIIYYVIYFRDEA